MKADEIASVTGADVLTGKKSCGAEIQHAFSSDLMSDVLTIDMEKLLLITGLNNLQTIRTAEMAEIACILFARNKKPTPEMIALAKKENMILMVSEKSVFHLSGLLYKAGIKPVY
jgi:hypothetical protein